MSMLIDVSRSQLMALHQILLEETIRPGRATEYVDVVRQVTTKPEELLVLFSDPHDKWTPLLAKVRDTFEAELIAEVKKFNGIPHLPQETMALRDAIAELLEAVSNLTDGTRIRETRTPGATDGQPTHSG